MRALIYNNVIGVSQGYEKKLNLVGVGYKAEVKNKALHLSLGFFSQSYMNMILTLILLHQLQQRWVIKVLTNKKLVR